MVDLQYFLYFCCLVWKVLMQCWEQVLHLVASVANNLANVIFIDAAAD